MEVWGRSERWRGGRGCQRSTWPMYVARGLWVGLQVSVKRMCCTTHLHGGFGPAVATRSPIVGEVFKLSAHSLLNNALYLPYSMLNAPKIYPWKCGGRRQGRSP